jgi:CDP-diglyceride synthetase
MFALLVLIGAANTAPLLAKSLLGARLARPVDGGAKFFDGRPLFGKSKTLRGLLVGVLAPALVAPLLGHPAWQGLAIGSVAMAGDLLSSFTKRRLGLTPSSQASGLDQIPEALLPALVARAWFGLSVWHVVIVLVAFVVLEIVLSKLLFRLKLRDRPY